MKPKGKVFYDEHEAAASEYLDTFKNQEKRDPELLHKASLEFNQSTNPEGKEIAQLLEAWSLREKGVQEKDHRRACRFLIKSYSTFSKDKRMANDAKKVLLEFYKRKVEIAHAEEKKSTEIFLKMAKINNELGQEENYHVMMSLYCLFSSTDDLRNLPVAIKKLEEGLGYAKKSGRKEIVYKLQGILHKMKSHTSATPEEAIKELEKEIKAIEKTSDKYGRETALGDLNFLRSRVEREPIKRTMLLEEAAIYYEKAGMQSRAHQLMGDVYQIKGNSSSPLDEDHAGYYKRAAEEYEKAGNVRMQKWLEGHYEIALATKLGMLADNSNEFTKHLMEANHLYKDAGNIGGVQFTAGLGIFLDAVRADYPKSIELFKAAAECLESVKENYLASFARSEVARIMASKSNNKEESVRLMTEEKNYLERAIIESLKRKTTQTITFPVGGTKISPEILTNLSKARLEELNGFLEKDRGLANAHFRRAKQEYLAIENSGAYQTLVLSGIGWTSLFLEDISEAKKYFESLKKIDPKSSHVRLGLEAVDQLIKVKYSPQSEDFLIKKRLSTPLIISLTNDISIVKSGKPYPTEFFNICLAIVKRSCNQIERYKSNFFDLDEQSIRNEILMLSNSIAEEGLGATLTGETFTGKGKSDIFAKDSQEVNDFFIGESKIWKSPSEYKKGFKQLTDRYLTATDRAGVLVNFVKNGKMSDILDKAVAAVMEIDPVGKINRIDGKNFVSVHSEYGIIFHHLVDLVPDRNTTKK